MTNNQFSKGNLFTNHCKKADVKPTKRQASKFRNKQGAVYQIAVLRRKGIHVPDNAKYQ